jgi:hypothetical protein
MPCKTTWRLSTDYRDLDLATIELGNYTGANPISVYIGTVIVTDASCPFMGRLPIDRDWPPTMGIDGFDD